MVREALKNDVPELWRQRAKAGMCPVCGKTPREFDKGMRIYCSHNCRDKYAEKYTYWSEVRDKILKRDNNTCKQCGINIEKHRKWYDEEEQKRLKEWIEKNRSKFETKRDEMLVHLSKRFEEDYNEIMDDMKLANSRLYHVKNELMRGVSIFGYDMEVDHIVAVALDGDMWDENNMQTLCHVCHKKKTKKDMKKIKDNKIMVNSQQVIGDE